jgi:CMP-2-keto-3-deoxyoctulosonic acid synthetase
VVVEAMLPVAARAATAKAASLVLIDMENSVRLKAARHGPHVPIGRRHARSGSERAREIFVIRIGIAFTAG